MAVAPAILREAEIEIAEGAAGGDAADRARARQILALQRGEALMRLVHLSLGPAGKAFLLRPRRDLVAAQDQRVEDAVAQRLLAQGRPTRLAGSREHLAATGEAVEVLADHRRIEQHLPVIGGQRGYFISGFSAAS